MTSGAALHAQQSAQISSSWYVPPSSSHNVTLHKAAKAKAKGSTAVVDAVVGTGLSRSLGITAAGALALFSAD